MDDRGVAEADMNRRLAVDTVKGGIEGLETILARLLGARCM
jgi:hypothetical protein